jgi:hypothetical protein
VEGEIMDYGRYLENVSEKLKYNFDFIENINYEDIEFSLTAKSNIRNERYVGSKKTVIYAYENNEYCFFKTIDNVSSVQIDKIAKVLKKAADEYVEPSDEHMSTTFTGIIVTKEPINSQLEEKIKKFKYQKSFKFGFHGWASVRLIVVELSTGKVIGSREAKKVSKFYKPF